MGAHHKLGSDPSLQHLAAKKGFGRGSGVQLSGSPFTNIHGFYRKMLDFEQLPECSEYPCYVKDNGNETIYICQDFDYEWRIFTDEKVDGMVTFYYFNVTCSPKIPMEGWVRVRALPMEGWMTFFGGGTDEMPIFKII